jgi:hypothetical protein
MLQFFDKLFLTSVNTRCVKFNFRDDYIDHLQCVHCFHTLSFMHHLTWFSLLSLVFLVIIYSISPFSTLPKVSYPYPYRTKPNATVG